MLSLGSLSVYAEGESPNPKVYASDTTVTAGNTTYLYIYASDFVDVGAIDIYAFYDPEVFTITNYWVAGMASGQQTSVNTSTPGEACFSILSLDGLNGSGALFEIALRANSNAPAGSYNFVLAVGDAYNTSLEPISVGVSSPKITVNSRTTPQKSLSVYNSGNNYYYTYYKDDEVTVQFATNNAQGLTSAEFEFEYDETVLEFESLSLGYKLTSATNALASENTDIPGYIKVSYVATSAVEGGVYPIISVKFKVISEEVGNTAVSLKVSGLYDSALDVISGCTSSETINIGKRVEAPTLPQIGVSGFNGTGTTADVFITAPASSSLAAVDFEIRFDSSKVSCASAVCEADGCFVISNIDNSNGIIKFSFICEEGISVDTELIKLSFSREGLSGGAVTLNVYGKNAVDENYNSISFAYESPTLYFHVLGNETTCTDPQICTICYEQFEPALGHDEIPHNAKAPSCTEIGWDAYVTCSRCSYSTYNELSVLPHPTIAYEARSATCTEIGWDAYETCTVCSYTTYEEIAALGHRVLVGGKIWVDSISVSNDPNYPFAFDGETYSSTNKIHSTDSYFTITALYDCTLNISYSVSSEQNYDKLIIRKNGVEVHQISGTFNNISREISLLAGDIVTINYHKDGSVDNGQDTGWFSFTCAQTEVDGRVPGPAEDAEPTCTDAVVCYYCQTVVKTALGHTGGNWYSTKVPTCTDTGTDERECSVCHTKETRITDALGHTNAVPVVENKVEPTCTANGSYDSVTYCSVCKAEVSREAKTIAKLGHNEILHNGKTATCTEGGWKEYVTCSRCDYSTYEVINALGHDEIFHTGSAPTCTEKGWQEYVTCTRCDYSTYVEIFAIGHNMSGWIIDEEAMFDMDGRKHKECTTCGMILEESIVPMLSHKYVSVVTPPTCTERGYTTHTCGECKNTYVDDYIPARGHTNSSPIEENVVGATCTEDGNCDSVVYCSICRMELSREQQTITKLGHDYSTEWTVDVEPTCTEKGNKSHHCTRCNDKADITEIPASAHTDNDKSHVCDNCSSIISNCMDANRNHKCDYCDRYMGVHKAATGTDICEYCGVMISTGDESDGLSSGAIAGIVIGSTTVAAGGGFAVWWFAISKHTAAELGTASKAVATKVGTVCKAGATKVGKVCKNIIEKIKKIFNKKK